MQTTEPLLKEIPDGYRDRFVEIVMAIDQFCDTFLNEEYKDVARKLSFAVCQTDSPVLKGKAASWASGVMYAIARINFLTDPSQSPHMKSEEIAAGFGVSPATMSAKKRDIESLLDLFPLDPDFTIASRLEENPQTWMLTVNGVLMDIRAAPRGAREVAYEMGLIPYIPDDFEDEETVQE